MKKLLISTALVLLSAISVYSQSLIWEREYEIDEPLVLSLLPTIIDSDNNIVSALDPSVFPFVNSYFFKYDLNGNILSFKQNDINQMICPVAISQTETGYNLFGAISGGSDKWTTCNPMIINTFKNGDTSNIKIPYDIYNDKLSTDISFKVSGLQGVINNNTLAINNKFYNATIKNSLKIASIKSVSLSHLIISSYDTNGRVVWRKGIDTVASSMDKYYFFDMKLTKENNLLILTVKQFFADNNIQVQIREIDSTGLLIKSIKFPVNENPWAPRGIEKLNNDAYIVLGQHTGGDSGTDFILVKINAAGEIIKQVELPVRNLKVKFNGISKTPDGNLLVLGKTLIDLKDADNVYDDIYKIFLYQVDSQLNYVSELQYYEHTYQNISQINHIHFIDNDNFIGIGYKDRFKFYIAKFSLKPTDVSETIYDKTTLSISPNPASDYIEITISNGARPNGNEASPIASEYIQIFNTLGEIVSSVELTPSPVQRIDISNLLSGIYFIKIGNKLEKFVKM
jgi:hypothetical protein